MLSTEVLSNENQTCRGWEAPASIGGGGCHCANLGYRDKIRNCVEGDLEEMRGGLLLTSLNPPIGNIIPIILLITERTEYPNHSNKK